MLMRNQLVVDSYYTMESYDDLEYLLCKILFHSAPTLFGGKVASLISFKQNRRRNVLQLWNQYRKEIKKYIPLNFCELSRDEKHVVVLFYHSKRLGKNLKETSCHCFLQSCGYASPHDIKSSLKCLRQRFVKSCPHEIGVFLGYPIEDVKCFASGKNEEPMVIGYWKVYSKVQEALNIFAQYDQAREDVSISLLEGIHPTQVVEKLYQAVS